MTDIKKCDREIVLFDCHFDTHNSNDLNDRDSNLVQFTHAMGWCFTELLSWIILCLCNVKFRTIITFATQTILEWHIKHGSASSLIDCLVVRYCTDGAWCNWCPDPIFDFSSHRLQEYRPFGLLTIAWWAFWITVGWIHIQYLHH